MSDSENYSRRDFLESIGQLAGGSAVYRAALGLTGATAACDSSSASDMPTVAAALPPTTSYR